MGEPERRPTVVLYQLGVKLANHTTTSAKLTVSVARSAISRELAEFFQYYLQPYGGSFEHIP